YSRFLFLLATPPTSTYTLSLHDALPILLSAYMDDHFVRLCQTIGKPELAQDARFATNRARVVHRAELMSVLRDALSHFDSDALRSEEHTSELQSRENLVCRLLLRKKKNK